MNSNKIEIIPAIDLIDGKCVRLTQGNYIQKKIYSDDPLKIALQFEENNISRLHLVDLDGAKERKVIHWNILKKLATHTKLIIDFGGGIQNDEDLKNVFECGAHIATIGSIAVKNPNLFKKWIKNYGNNKILLGIDVKNEKILIHGWKKNTNISIWKFIEKKISEGVKQFFCTDIEKDGLLLGPSINLYQRIIQKFPNIKLIASGGINKLKDLKKLKNIGCKGIIIGKAIYENKIQLSELKNFINAY